MEKLINGLLAALNKIKVDGKENHELVLGCIIALEKLKAELEGVYHGGDGKKQELSGETVLSAAHKSGTDDCV